MAPEAIRLEERLLGAQLGENLEVYHFGLGGQAVSSPFDNSSGKVSVGRRLGRSALSIAAAIVALMLLGTLVVFVLG